MKLKTLFAVLSLLCISLFIVACDSADGTTAAPATTTPATTTAATTTAATTKINCNRCTTTSRKKITTVTTTLAPDYMSKLPASLPHNETFEIHTRIGLDMYFYLTLACICKRERSCILVRIHTLRDGILREKCCAIRRCISKDQYMRIDAAIAKLKRLLNI